MRVIQNGEADTSGRLSEEGQATADHCREAPGWSVGRGRRMCGQKKPFLWF